MHSTLQVKKRCVDDEVEVVNTFAGENHDGVVSYSMCNSQLCSEPLAALFYQAVGDQS